MLVVISTDSTGSCISNYHTITTMAVPGMFGENTAKFDIIYDPVLLTNYSWNSA